MPYKRIESRTLLYIRLVSGSITNIVQYTQSSLTTQPVGSSLPALSKRDIKQTAAQPRYGYMYM